MGIRVCGSVFIVFLSHFSFFVCWVLAVSIGMVCYTVFYGLLGGAFVHEAFATPCPSFNCGKFMPGGGRRSRSPPGLLTLSPSHPPPPSP